MLRYLAVRKTKDHKVHCNKLFFFYKKKFGGLWTCTGSVPRKLSEAHRGSLARGHGLCTATARMMESDDGDDFDMKSAGSQPFDALDEACKNLDEFENYSEVRSNASGDSGAEDVVDWTELTDNASDEEEDEPSRYQEAEAFEDEDTQHATAQSGEDELSELAAGEPCRGEPAMLIATPQHGMEEANNEAEVPIAPHALFDEQGLATMSSMHKLLEERKKLALNPLLPRRRTGRSARM